jgi:alginate O-acetyltransferase complex protein AlgJ
MAPDVCQGQDGWLFLTGALATFYDRTSGPLADARLADWVKLIETRATRLERLGIQYVHMPAPEKLTIYDNKFNDPIVDWRLSPGLRLGEIIQRSPCAHVWLDVIRPLREARDRRPLFPKTDSHWNAEGAFIAYKHLCERIGLAPDFALLSRKSVDYHTIFDLGAKMTRRGPNGSSSTISPRIRVGDMPTRSRDISKPSRKRRWCSAPLTSPSRTSRPAPQKRSY